MTLAPKEERPRGTSLRRALGRGIFEGRLSRGAGAQTNGAVRAGLEARRDGGRPPRIECRRALCGVPVAACRRARRCVGNKAPCKRLSETELEPAELQRLVEGLYAAIEHDARAAGYEGRPPCVRRRR